MVKVTTVVIGRYQSLWSCRKGDRYQGRKYYSDGGGGGEGDLDQGRWVEVAVATVQCGSGCNGGVDGNCCGGCDHSREVASDAGCG